MSTCIIDPSTFYWINVLESIRAACVCLIVFSIGTVIIGTVCGLFAKEDGDGKTVKLCKKVSLIGGILAIISILGSIFIPCKATSIEMLIAKNITTDNINWTVQQIKEVIDYVIMAIK